MTEFSLTRGTFCRTQTVYAERFTGEALKCIGECEPTVVDGVPRLRVPTPNGPMLAHLGDWVLHDGRSHGVIDDLIFRRDWAPVGD